MIPSHPWRRARSSLFARESRIVPTLAMLRSLGATHGHPRTHAPRRFIFESQKLEMIDRLKTSPPLSPSRTTTPVGKATSAPGLRSSESAALSIAPPCDDGRNRSPKARACIPALARLDICGAPKNEEVKSMDEFATLDGAAPNATVDLSALVKRTLQDMPGSPMMGGMTSMVPCS